jgi:hypothetical protein
MANYLPITEVFRTMTPTKAISALVHFARQPAGKSPGYDRVRGTVLRAFRETNVPCREWLLLEALAGLLEDPLLFAAICRIHASSMDDRLRICPICEQAFAAVASRNQRYCKKHCAQHAARGQSLDWWRRQRLLNS